MISTIFLFFALAYAQVSETIDQFINDSSNFTAQQVDLYGGGGDAHTVREFGFDSLQDGKDLVFSVHDMFESALIAVSPIELDPTFLTIIMSAGAVLLVYGVLKHIGKHLIWFGVGFGILIAVLLFLNINPDF